MDQLGPSNSPWWQEPYTPQSVGTFPSILTISVADLRLSLRRPPAASSKVKALRSRRFTSNTAIAGGHDEPHLAPTGRSHHQHHPEHRRSEHKHATGKPLGDTRGRSTNLNSGDFLNLASPQTPEGHPVEFSHDLDLREPTVVTGSDLTSTVALMDLGWTFQLHSSPTSSKVIYLDFNGHTTTGTSWNSTSMGSSFYSPAYDIDGKPAVFNTEELSRIQQIWQRVAADYAPFDVDVTTQAPPTDWLIKSNRTDPNYGIRVVITSYGPSSSTAGGIAIVNSFNAGTDTPCFVYNKSLTGVAEAISHEVGHTLGLSHDGTSGSAYYYGNGSSETSWAPIMGVGYNKNVTTWDNGTYYGSNNGSASANYGRGPNDMSVITTNGFGYQLDQIGNAPSSAAALTITGGVVRQFGRIETSLDSDFYSFQLKSSGNVNLKFDPYCYRAFVDRDGLWGGSKLVYTAPVSDGNSGTPYADNGTNLDLSVGLYSSSGSLLGTFNGAGLATTLAWSNLAAGTYYLKLDGVGAGKPTGSTPSGYNDYGSVGNYLITGTITNPVTSSTPLATTTALAPKSSTFTAATSTTGKAAIPAAAPRDSLTGIALRSVNALAFQSDPLASPRLAAKALGSASQGFAAAKIAGIQEGPIAVSAVAPLLGAVGESSRSPFAADLPTTFAAPGLGSERLNTERPAWALA